MPDAIHTQICTAAVARLQALSLGGLQDRVHRLGLITAASLATLSTWPCLVVSAAYGNRRYPPGLTASVDRVYPLSIRLFERANAWQAAPLDAHLLTLETILDAFEDKRLTVTGADNYTVTPLDGPVLEDWPGQLDLVALPLFFECPTRKLRTA